MKIAKKIAYVCLICAFATETRAAGYKDVDAAFWAFDYIVYVSGRGLMFGDTQGFFKPSEATDIFSAYKIFARAAGFNLSGASSEETLYYSRAYEKNKTLLSELAREIKTWDKSAEREIAFLIERQIISRDDFSRGFSQALTREAAAALAAKIFGRIGEARSAAAVSFNAGQTRELYADDSEISVLYKPYIYYLSANGIFAPEKFFYPRREISRAELATLLYKSEECFGWAAGAANESAVVVSSASGTIEAFYPASRALEVVLPNGEKDVYLVADNCVVTSEGFLKTSADLKKGMKFQAVLNNASIVDMNIADIKIEDWAAQPHGVNTAAGEIKEIFISESVAKITVLSGGENKIYTADPDDAYSFKIGMKVALALDGGKIIKIKYTER